MAKQKAVRVIVESDGEYMGKLFVWLFIYPMAFLIITGFFVGLFLKIKDFLFSWF